MGLTDRFLLDAITQMTTTAEPLDRLKVAAETLQKLGWARVSIALFETSLPVIMATQSGIFYAHQNDPALLELQSPSSFPAPPRLGSVYPSKSGLIYPLVMTDQTIAGVIRLENHASGNPMTAEQLAPVELLVLQAAAALETARLTGALQSSRDRLEEQVVELTILQKVDEELNASLNLDNVMMLASDWALRRTGARAVILAVTSDDGMGLIPLVSLGYPKRFMPYSLTNPIPLTKGIVGRAARNGETCIVRDVTLDPDYDAILPGMKTQIAVPLEMQGNILGVLSLESDDEQRFGEAEIEFIKRLAARAAVALDNARLYRMSEKRADEASSLYSASRTIYGTLERDQLLPRITQAAALVIGVTGSILTDLRLKHEATATFQSTYRVPTAKRATEKFPPVGTVLDLTLMPTVLTAIRQRDTVTLVSTDQAVSAGEQGFLIELNIRSAIFTPLVVGEEVFGMLIATHSTEERHFNRDEKLLFETLASQAAVALRQVKLYEEVSELENLKSEMIRMASHDLRNPLGNVIGYIDLLNVTLPPKVMDEVAEYIQYMKKSAMTMKSLIDDLLTLEKIESERQQSFTRLDLGALLQDVFEVQTGAAELKKQSLNLEYMGQPVYVLGSTTQVRQAVTNLVGNAIKYTPDAGRVTVRLFMKQGRAYFEVEDNGYGISPDRQKRLFQRFYRAKQPGTEEIPGTGLGLNMVKTIIERHGGEVWVKSTEGVGSTFGFWLPTAETVLNQMRTTAATSR
jgi:signal transduction histidine kinase